MSREYNELRKRCTKLGLKPCNGTKQTLIDKLAAHDAAAQNASRSSRATSLAKSPPKQRRAKSPAREVSATEAAVETPRGLGSSATSTSQPDTSDNYVIYCMRGHRLLRWRVFKSMEGAVDYAFVECVADYMRSTGHRVAREWLDRSLRAYMDVVLPGFDKDDLVILAVRYSDADYEGLRSLLAERVVDADYHYDHRLAKALRSAAMIPFDSTMTETLARRVVAGGLRRTIDAIVTDVRFVGLIDVLVHEAMSRADLLAYVIEAVPASSVRAMSASQQAVLLNHGINMATSHTVIPMLFYAGYLDKIDTGNLLMTLLKHKGFDALVADIFVRSAPLPYPEVDIIARLDKPLLVDILSRRDVRSALDAHILAAYEAML